MTSLFTGGNGVSSQQTNTPRPALRRDSTVRDDDEPRRVTFDTAVSHSGGDAAPFSMPSSKESDTPVYSHTYEDALPRRAPYDYRFTSMFMDDIQQPQYRYNLDKLPKGKRDLLRYTPHLLLRSYLRQSSIFFLNRPESRSPTVTWVSYPSGISA